MQNMPGMNQIEDAVRWTMCRAPGALKKAGACSNEMIAAGIAFSASKVVAAERASFMNFML
jgi:hypothetical protein